jgi:hypothetical protein
MRLTRSRTTLALSLLTLALAFGALLFWSKGANDKPPPIPDPSRAKGELARRVASVLAAHRAELQLKPVPEPRVYIALRKNGLRIASGFVTGADWPTAVLDGVAELASKNARAAEADTVELCLPHSRHSIALRAKKPPMGEAHRGVRGLTLRHEDAEQTRCPTQMLSDNKNYDQLLDDFRVKRGLSKEAAVDAIEAEAFDAYQWLVRIDKPALTKMFRGNTVVPLEAVDAPRVKQLAQGMTSWMKTQVQPDGRMVYMYFPSKGEESNGNNMIRQFMATLCLQRIANREKTEEARELARRNLHYNLTHFYQRDGEHGLIDELGKKKLGGIALAALSIVESPFRAEFADYELSLRKTVESMQQPDGSFRTFYGTDRNDNQNFYPGEALLLWASLLDEDPSSPLAERFDRAFVYYRTWHRENRNPAFIPWHTQAYYKVWKRTRDERLRDFMFEMNDFLADFQQWEKAPYDDLRGRFYDPDRRAFGPPHASSTGVYLEGFTDARELARAVSDKTREQRYNLAIKRSLRSMMQLQFQDAIDMFYISKRERVLGGLRTNEYDNAIRVDNVQHSLMGLQKLLDDVERGHPL